MIDHLIGLAAHELVHRAVHAYRHARDAKNATEYLKATYELLERIRVGQLWRQPQAMEMTVGAIAQVLTEARSHRSDYRALQDKHPEQFAQLQALMADYDYKLRSEAPGKTMHSIHFQTLTMRLRSTIESFGVDVPMVRHQVRLPDHEAGSGGLQIDDAHAAPSPRG